MNDRDFKLLVREYFIHLSLRNHRQDHNRNGVTTHSSRAERIDDLEKKILKELERFTAKEQEELPFKD